MRASSELHRPRTRTRGAILVEFALIALVLYLLLGAILEFGRALHCANTIQQAADLMARELARTPLPPASTFEEALNTAEVRKRIFDDRLLVIDLDQNPNLDAVFATFPIVNQQLRAVMIFQEVNGRRLIHYPGALVTAGDEDLDPLPLDSGLRVLVPIVESRGEQGVETIRWARVVEEVTGPPAFALNSTNPNAGMATVRINYPFQAATLSGYQSVPDAPFEPNLDRPIRADDAAVTAGPLPDGQSLSGGSVVGPYAGQYGLGRQEAWGQVIGPVRPFRRVLVGQGAYRREIFGNP